MSDLHALLAAALPSQPRLDLALESGISAWQTAREELHHVGTIIAEDATHGREIRRLMQPEPWKGRVLVPDPRQAAA